MGTTSRDSQDGPALYTRRRLLKLSGFIVGMGGMAVLPGCGPAAPDARVGMAPEAADGSSSGALGDGVTLRVGMEAAYAPFNWQTAEPSEFTIPIENVSGAYADGYDVQVAKVIAEALDMEPVAVKLDFSGLIDALDNGQIDIVCAGMSVTEERAKSADFSDSYLDDDVALIVRDDSPYVGATTFADLEGAYILGQMSTMYDDVIEQIPGCVHMTPAETIPLVVEKLASGSCDAITYSELSVPKLLEMYPNFVQLDMTDRFEGTPMPDNAAIALGQPEILERINDAIATISDDERQELWTACMDRQPA